MAEVKGSAAYYTQFAEKYSSWESCREIPAIVMILEILDL